MILIRKSGKSKIGLDIVIFVSLHHLKHIFFISLRKISDFIDHILISFYIHTVKVACKCIENGIYFNIAKEKYYPIELNQSYIRI